MCDNEPNLFIIVDLFKSVLSMEYSVTGNMLSIIKTSAFNTNGRILHHASCQQCGRSQSPPGEERAFDGFLSFFTVRMREPGAILRFCSCVTNEADTSTEDPSSLITTCLWAKYGRHQCGSRRSKPKVVRESAVCLEGKICVNGGVRLCRGTSSSMPAPESNSIAKTRGRKIGLVKCSCAN